VAGGSLDGTVSEGGGAGHTYTWTTSGTRQADGSWLATGSGISGHDNERHYSYAGSGSYAAQAGNILVSGKVEEGGGYDAEDHLSATSVLGSGGWATSGSGLISWDATASYGYAGSGSATTTSSTSDSSGSTTTTVEEYLEVSGAEEGESHTLRTFEYLDGWWVTPLDSSAGAGSSKSSFTYSGSGQTKSDSTWGDAANGGQSESVYNWSWFEQAEWQSGWSDDRTTTRQADGTLVTTGSGGATYGSKGTVFASTDGSGSGSSWQVSAYHSRTEWWNYGSASSAQDTYDYTNGWSYTYNADGTVAGSGSGSGSNSGTNCQASEYLVPSLELSGSVFRVL
jgi:hypothetical protein